MNTTINNSSTFVGIELSKRINKATSNSKDAAARIKTLQDGFDEIVKNQQTSQNEKAICAFAKEFMKKVESNFTEEKPSFFGKLFNTSSSNNEMQVAAGLVFANAITTSYNGPMGPIIAKAIIDASKKTDENKAKTFIDNAFSEIVKNQQTSQDEKNIAAQGKDFINKISKNPACQVRAGNTFLEAIASSNAGSLAPVLAKAVYDASRAPIEKLKENERSDSSYIESKKIITDGLIEIMTNSQISQNDKTIASLGKEFMEKISDKPDFQIAAASSVLYKIVNSSRQSLTEILAIAISYTAKNANDEQAKAKIMEDGLSEIIIHPATTQNEKAMASCAKEIMNVFGSSYSKKTKAGNIFLENLRGCNTGQIESRMAETMLKVKEIDSDWSYRLTCDSYKIIKENPLISHDTKLKLNFTDNLLERSWFKTRNEVEESAKSSVLESIASPDKDSLTSTMVKVVRNATYDKGRTWTSGEYNGYRLEDGIAAIMESPDVSDGVKMIAKSGLDGKHENSKLLDVLNKIDELGKKEPALKNEVMDMAQACKEHPGSIAINNNHIDINGVKIPIKES